MPVRVMWEPTQGKQYAVLFSRLLEVYSVDEEEPVHSVTFDTNQTSFTYVGRTQIVVSDDKGRLSVFYGVQNDKGDSGEGVQMFLVKTDFTRFKSLQASPDHSFFSVLTNSSVAIWGTQALKKVFDENPDD